MSPLYTVVVADILRQGPTRALLIALFSCGVSFAQIGIDIQPPLATESMTTKASSRPSAVTTFTPPLPGAGRALVFVRARPETKYDQHVGFTGLDKGRAHAVFRLAASYSGGADRASSEWFDVPLVKISGAAAWSFAHYATPPVRSQLRDALPPYDGQVAIIVVQAHADRHCAFLSTVSSGRELVFVGRQTCERPGTVISSCFGSRGGVVQPCEDHDR